MKRILVLSMALCLLLLCACSQPFTGLGGKQGVPASDTAKNAVSITLTGSGAEIRGGGAKAEGNVITVSAAGAYRISGTLDEGQLIVDTGDDAVDVTLILDGAEIRSASGPAIWIKQAKNLYLQLAANSENLLVSGTEADLAGYDETRSGAAIYAEDDLIVDGGGRLTVKGYLNNGITCKDDLTINSGTLDVESANNGVRASESIEITGGTLFVRSGNDGLKTSSDKKAGKGWIEISGGGVQVESGGDGVSAVTALRVTGGDLTVVSRQDLIGNQSRKGLKASEIVELSGGSVRITSDDDAVHSDGGVLVSGGDLTIVAATGIQAGVKDSGAGDVKFTGGSVYICAVKQAVKAEGEFYADCELLALCGSEKQAAPRTGGQAWLMGPVSGSAGDELIIGLETERYTAALRFKTLLYSSSSLTAGELYPLSCGSQSYTLTAVN